VVPEQQTSGRGTVVAVVPDPDENASEHERCTLLRIAQRLAVLRGDDVAGFHDASVRYGGRVYFVPSSTLTSAQAAGLGIRGEDDLFGGVVPHAFVGTKAIGHPLVAPGAAAVAGWTDCFAQHVGDAVFAGYTVFDRADARVAGQRMLARGPVRLKRVRSRGGHGQAVVRDAASLQAQLDAMDSAEIAGHGLVLEEDLQELTTFSVGNAQVADLTVSYVGSQRTTISNHGARVFGGSDLTFVRGGFDALLAVLRPPPEVARAIAQAQRYDAAARTCFPGFYASRNNYDVLLGRDAAGAVRSAVLEQSWRVGGATGAEIAALEAFRVQPGRERVRASCIEIFGPSPEPPAHATVYYRGTDARAGLLTKYTVLHQDDNAR
jgi:hypothetical protein